jgi:hypothetical protein
VSDAIDITSIVGSHDLGGRKSRFSERLGENNKFEACRVHRTEWHPLDDATCKLHTDEHNGKHAQANFCARVYQTVTGTWRRDGGVYYWRRAVDEHEDRRLHSLPWLQAVNTAVDSFDGRYSVDSNTFRTAELIKYYPGVELLKRPCNLQVDSYYQPFMANAVRLQVGFGLDEHQVASVVLAMAQSACSAGYSSAAVDLLLAMKNRINCDDVGWCLLVTIKRMDVYSAEQSKAIKMNPSLRFA